MPNTRSAAKRLRQSLKRREYNRFYKSTMKTAIRKCVQTADSSQDPAAAHEAYTLAQQAIDKAARKGVIHPNQAARRKSRLARLLARKQAAAAPVTRSGQEPPAEAAGAGGGSPAP